MSFLFWGPLYWNSYNGTTVTPMMLIFYQNNLLIANNKVWKGQVPLFFSIGNIEIWKCQKTAKNACFWMFDPKLDREKFFLYFFSLKCSHVIICWKIFLIEPIWIFAHLGLYLATWTPLATKNSSRNKKVILKCILDLNAYLFQILIRSLKWVN